MTIYVLTTEQDSGFVCEPKARAFRTLEKAMAAGDLYFVDPECDQWSWSDRDGVETSKWGPCNGHLYHHEDECITVTISKLETE